MLAVASLTAGQAVAGPIDLLPGRWSGWGHMMLDGGAVERIKCIATYSAENGGGELRHSLRCASSDYRIDAVARLKVRQGLVSGDWQERTYASGGAVRGVVKGDGIDVMIEGDRFSARMTVDTRQCTQSMRISPEGMGVRRIAVELRKC